MTLGQGGDWYQVTITCQVQRLWCKSKHSSPSTWAALRRPDSESASAVNDSTYTACSGSSAWNDAAGLLQTDLARKRLRAPLRSASQQYQSASSEALQLPGPALPAQPPASGCGVEQHEPVGLRLLLRQAVLAQLQDWKPGLSGCRLQVGQSQQRGPMLFAVNDV